MHRTQFDGRDSRDRRRGLTRVEVGVLIGIVALLAAFFAPAVRSSRGPSRKIQCLNNAQQLGMSMHFFASVNDGILPPLADFEVIKSEEDSKRVGTLAIGWPVAILPAMDNYALLKGIRLDAVVESGVAPDAVMRIPDLDRVYVFGYTCPEDSDSHQLAGGLSYVVNAGFMARSLYHGDPDGRHRLGQLSWDGNGVAGEENDIEISAATGVFWRKNEAFQPSLDYVGEGDGTTNTLLLTENLQAGNWWDTDTTRIAFGLPVETVNGRVPFGKGTYFESVEKPLNTQFDGGTLTSSQPRDWRINSDLKAAIGTRPRPSSNHNGGVNVIMCDGSGKFINELIDPHVYVKLLTSNGVNYGEDELKQSSY